MCGGAGVMDAAQGASERSGACLTSSSIAIVGSRTIEPPPKGAVLQGRTRLLGTELYQRLLARGHLDRCRLAVPSRRP